MEATGLLGAPCPDPAELETFLKPLVDAGADMFHCSTRRFWEPEFEGSSLNLAGWTKKLTGHPTITVGSVGLNQSDFTKRETEVAVGGLEDLEERLERDEFDLVAVGRALITQSGLGSQHSDRAPRSASAILKGCVGDARLDCQTRGLYDALTQNTH